MNRLAPIFVDKSRCPIIQLNLDEKINLTDRQNKNIELIKTNRTDINVVQSSIKNNDKKSIQKNKREKTLLEYLNDRKETKDTYKQNDEIPDIEPSIKEKHYKRNYQTN